MQKMIPLLTDRQRYWLEQVQACEASGKSMVDYAASQDISVRDMYAGKKTLVKKGVLPDTRPVRFQRVQVMEAAAATSGVLVYPTGYQWLLSERWMRER